MDNVKTLILAILAGISISLGCWISLSTANPIMGATLFACGLLAVRILKFDLFTGKTQFLLTKEKTLDYYIIVLCGNIVGCFMMALISTEAIKAGSLNIATAKVSQTFPLAFMKGLGCGMLMTIATHKNTPLFVSVMCVMAFILAGFNHCIADAFYMFAANKYGASWLATLAGNIIGGAVIGIVNNKSTFE